MFQSFLFLMSMPWFPVLKIHFCHPLTEIYFVSLCIKIQFTYISSYREFHVLSKIPFLDFPTDIKNDPVGLQYIFFLLFGVSVVCYSYVAFILMIK